MLAMNQDAIVGAVLHENARLSAEQIVEHRERRKAEKALRAGEHANRVAILGQLSASIAHEVIQPIGATASNAQAATRLLGHQPPDLEEARQALAQIVRDATRAGDILQDIRTLMKKAPSRNELLDS